MSDGEENKPAEGSEPITIRVRDQVSGSGERKSQQRTSPSCITYFALQLLTILPLCFIPSLDGRGNVFQNQKVDQNGQSL